MRQGSPGGVYGGALYADGTSSVTLVSTTVTAMSGTNVNATYNTVNVASGGSVTQPSVAPTWTPTALPTTVWRGG